MYRIEEVYIFMSNGFCYHGIGENLLRYESIMNTGILSANKGNKIEVLYLLLKAYLLFYQKLELRCQMILMNY